MREATGCWAAGCCGCWRRRTAAGVGGDGAEGLLRREGFSGEGAEGLLRREGFIGESAEWLLRRDL